VAALTAPLRIQGTTAGLVARIRPGAARPIAESEKNNSPRAQRQGAVSITYGRRHEGAAADATCGYALGFSSVLPASAAVFSLLGSLVDVRNSRIALPTAPPISGNRPTPKMMMTITNMMISSKGPKRRGMSIFSFVSWYCIHLCGMIIAYTVSARKA